MLVMYHMVNNLDTNCFHGLKGLMGYECVMPLSTNVSAIALLSILSMEKPDYPEKSADLSQLSMTLNHI